MLICHIDEPVGVERETGGSFDTKRLAVGANSQERMLQLEVIDRCSPQAARPKGAYQP